MVGNRHHLDCRHVCAALVVHIKDIVFNIDLHVLPLCGAHIVLDAQWLKSLGSVLTDYNDLSMKFSRDGRVVEFKGDIASNLSLLTPSQLRRLVRKSGASALFHICILPTELPSDQAPPNQLLPKIQTLITKFISLFQQPSTLPLSRPTNHHIHTFLPTRTQWIVRTVIHISRNKRLGLMLIQCYNEGLFVLVPTRSPHQYCLLRSMTALGDFVSTIGLWTWSR